MSLFWDQKHVLVPKQMMINSKILVCFIGAKFEIKLRNNLSLFAIFGHQKKIHVIKVWYCRLT